MRRVEFYFRETAAGIRRNGTVAFGAVSTAFIALFLFGLSLLIYREFNLVIENLTGNVEVAVYMTDPVNQDTVVHLTDTLQKLSAVGPITYETKAQACDNFHRLFRGQPGYDQVDCDVIPASLRVKLNDTAQFSQVTAALGCSEDANGKLIGKHVSTGVARPAFWDRARYYGEEQRLAAALEAMEKQAD